MVNHQKLLQRSKVLALICLCLLAALQNLQLKFLRCGPIYCGAALVSSSHLPLPFLGVSSLDLGRSDFRTTPFFGWCCYSAA